MAVVELNEVSVMVKALLQPSGRKSFGGPVIYIFTSVSVAQ
jgi:hypothetical protein